VVIFVDDLVSHRTVVLRTDASSYGSWSVSTLTDEGGAYHIPHGRYSVSAVAEMPESQLRSMPSTAYTLDISWTLWDKLLVYGAYILKIVVIILLLSVFIVSF
jgi:hypothetical protein